MIADNTSASRVSSGSLASNLHVSGTSLLKLVEFIAEELPRWRDRARSGRTASETSLAAGLCAHLLSAARHSSWDFIQFRREEPDSRNTSRSIDMVAAPSGCVLWVEGQKYEDFDPLLPIECKRLPTPRGRKRDKREYLYNAHSTTGGIDRFKNGYHGADHVRAAMVGFIQSDSVLAWEGKLKRWVAVLTRARKAGWTLQDTLRLAGHDINLKSARLDSLHARTGGLQDIDLHHLWIEMA